MVEGVDWGRIAGGVEVDRRELEVLGTVLDERPRPLKGRSTLEFLAQVLLKVRGKDGRLRALKPNAVQRQYELRRGAGNIVLKARQMGMTTWIAGRFLLKTMTQPGTLTLQVAQTQETAETLLRIAHRFVEHLPECLRDGVLRTSKSNVRQIVFPEIDSEFRVVSASDRNAGRGMTVQNLHCSEVAFWGEGAAEVLAGLRGGLAPGGELVLESTPWGVGDCFYEEWMAAGGEGGLVKHFFPWWWEKGYVGAAVEAETLKEEEKRLMAEHGLTLEQIGYRRLMRTGFKENVDQEFAEDPERCFAVTGDPYFDMEAVEERLKCLLGPVQRKDSGRLEVWLPPMAGKKYVVAVDPAGGNADGDWSAMQVIDLETGMQCAEYASHATGRELADAARQLGWDYNTAWLVVERNNHGSGLLWVLEHLGYWEIYAGRDGAPGLLTTSVSRPAMLARLAQAIVEEPGLFFSRKFLAECRSFVRKRDGNCGARPGTHDDRVMAMAVGLEARAMLLGIKGLRDQPAGNRDQRTENRGQGSGFRGGEWTVVSGQ